MPTTEDGRGPEEPETAGAGDEFIEERADGELLPEEEAIVPDAEPDDDLAAGPPDGR